MKVVITFILSGFVVMGCLIYHMYHMTMEELHALHTVTVTDYRGTKVFKNVDCLQLCSDTIRFRTSEGVHVIVSKQCNSIIIE